MRKKMFLLLALAALCALMLCACGECEHDWQAASCTAPKTCSLCGATEGEALAHTYAEATCDTAKTCTVCGTTEGAPLGHVWMVANCETPQTCTVCAATTGEALGHSWAEATCETAKTCSTCGAAEGEALGHVFADYLNCENPPKCSNCGIYSAEPTAHTWADATCDTAKTCTVCGATEGAPNGHEWYAATCETAKTCAVCGKVDGEALGHTWTDATCTAPRTCATCGAAEGEALGHSWADATTDAPKTCTVCGITEGERIITDPRFTTAACQAIFGNWICTDVSVYTSQNGTEIVVPYTAYMTFTNDGRWLVTEVYELEAYKAYSQVYLEEYLYAYYADMGYTADELDAAMLDQYGLSLQDYVAAIVAEYTQEDATDVSEYVYYVSGNQLYLASAWEQDFGANTFYMEDGVLYINKLSDGQLILTRDLED